EPAVATGPPQAASQVVRQVLAAELSATLPASAEPSMGGAVAAGNGKTAPSAGLTFEVGDAAMAAGSAPPPLASTQGTPGATGCSPTGGVLLANGGFEQGNDHWYLEAGAGAVAANPHGGSHALRLPAAGGYADQHLPIRACATYTLSAWALLGQPADAGVV